MRQQVWAKADIPWSVALSRVVCRVLAAKGFGGGRVGPFFRHEFCGLSFWDMDPDNLSTSSRHVRALLDAGEAPSLPTIPFAGTMTPRNRPRFVVGMST